MIPVRCQWRFGAEFLTEHFYACPREGEYVMVDGGHRKAVAK